MGRRTRGESGGSTNVINFRLTDEEMAKLVAIAVDDDRTPGQYARAILVKHLRTMEQPS